MSDNLPPGYAASLRVQEAAEARFEYALRRARECLEDMTEQPEAWTCDEAAAFLDVYDRYVFTFYDPAGEMLELKIHAWPEDAEP